MGAKDFLLIYADGQVGPILESGPVLDRAGTDSFVRRVYGGRVSAELGEGKLAEDCSPKRYQIYAGCFPEIDILCTLDAGLSTPSRLDDVFLREARRRDLYLHTMHGVSGWFSYAHRDESGRLRRSLSVSSQTGVVEDIGPAMPFEHDFWSGRRPVQQDDLLDGDLPVPFNPLEMGEDALQYLFGFGLEYYSKVDPWSIPLLGYSLGPAPVSEREEIR